MALSTAISGVYLPHITDLVAKRWPMQELSSLFIQIGHWQYYLLALVATSFIIFGRPFIVLCAGPGFEDAYWITILIILPFTIDLIQNIGLAILQSMNQYDFRAKIYFLTGLLNLLLAIPLGIRFGGLGCAVATGFSMLMGNGLVMNYFYHRYIGLDILSFWKQIGRVSVFIGWCLLIGYGLNVYTPGEGKLAFLLKIVGYTVLYGVMVYCLAMNTYEKEKVRKVIKRLC